MNKQHHAGSPNPQFDRKNHSPDQTHEKVYEVFLGISTKSQFKGKYSGAQEVILRKVKKIINVASNYFVLTNKISGNTERRDRRRIISRRR